MGDRYESLKGLIEALGPCSVAFSGGVDSSLVAKAAYDALGDNALAVTVVSELCPESEAREASSVARAIGIRHVVLRVSLLDNGCVASNPPDRCYHCKKEVFKAIRDAAAREGIGAILDGTNAEDAVSHRPGLRALVETGAVSPLARLGFSKAEVRLTAKAVGLPNSDRPSAPCLATRFPYGTRLTAEGIARVNEAEEFVRSLGIKVLRVRDHGGFARIEVGTDTLPGLVSEGTREKIVARLRSLGYKYVTLDLEGYRSGSMDINVQG